MNPAANLRQRQAEQVRLAILDAAVASLEERSVDDLSMGALAESAGISLRTLYRYFPDRPALLQAVGQHVVTSLALPIDINGADGISASFLDAARRFSDRPQLARALVQSAAGRAARSTARPERQEAVAAALGPVTEGLDPDVARRATAVIAHLCSLESWVSIANSSGLDDSEAQLAVAWAIDALVDALQENPTPTPGRRTGR